MTEINLHKRHSKFPHDAVEYSDERYSLSTSGVFLGIRTQGKDALAQFLLDAYRKKGESFVKDLRGSFWIYLRDKTSDKRLIYTNHSGDKRIYYYLNEDNLLVSNSVATLVERLRKQGIPFSLDSFSAYALLTYGHLFGNRSIIEQIKRLEPGQYLRQEGESTSLHHYHRLRNTPELKIPEQEAIDQLDLLFRKAVEKEFQKDLDYRLTPLVSLSGGLDCRMTTWIGHELGFTSMVNFTFAREGSLDMTIPREIVRKLDHRWIFTPLDEAVFMENVDDVMQLTEGFAHYLPLSHGKYAIDQLDFSSLGLLHTGQLGDVTLGSYCRQHKHSRATHQKYISDKLLHHLPDEDCLDYENQEMMLYLNRGLNYILMGNLPVQQHSEALSPFLDVDVLEFCLSLPLEYRAHHAIYKKWILQKYPDAARYKWESLGRRINARTVLINGKSIALTALPAFILQGIQYHLKGSKKVSARNRGMNPFPYWYAHRPGIRENLDRYFLNHVDLIRDPALKSDCEALYHDGSVYEKSQVLSLLSTFKLFLHP